MYLNVTTTWGTVNQPCMTVKTFLYLTVTCIYLLLFYSPQLTMLLLFCHIIIVRLLVKCYNINIKMSIQYGLLWQYCSMSTVMPIKHSELNWTEREKERQRETETVAEKQWETLKQTSWFHSALHMFQGLEGTPDLDLTLRVWPLISAKQRQRLRQRERHSNRDRYSVMVDINWLCFVLYMFVSGYVHVCSWFPRELWALWCFK